MSETIHISTQVTAATLVELLMLRLILSKPAFLLCLLHTAAAASAAAVHADPVYHVAAYLYAVAHAMDKPLVDAVFK